MMTPFCDNPKCHLHNLHVEQGQTEITETDCTNRKEGRIIYSAKTIHRETFALLEPNSNHAKTLTFCPVCAEAARMTASMMRGR